MHIVPHCNTSPRHRSDTVHDALHTAVDAGVRLQATGFVVQRQHLSSDVAESLKIRLGPERASEGESVRGAFGARDRGLPSDGNAFIRLLLSWRSAAPGSLPILDMRSALHVVLALPVLPLRSA